MYIELAHFALILALVLSLCQILVPILAKDDQNPHRFYKIADLAATGQLLFIFLSFCGLIWAYVTSDFSLKNVVLNSHTAKPMIYKISGVWGNHEGSMVLWVLILALFGASVAVFGKNLPPRFKSYVLAVQGLIGACFLAFILGASSPFERLAQAPFEGNGLNPILQDPALAFHPPFLYAGYVGFSMAFSFAVAALIEGKVDATWARWVRPWTLAAWMFLTLGISMGSWWAYYELGWGGWWFWDPVENASFMPWLSGTALLHSALVVEKRESLKVWTILLAILTFALSLLGTFLVRSGVLTSVHSFASDPARGVLILLIMGMLTGGALALYAWRAPRLRSIGLFSPISREGGLVLNNIFLVTGTAIVFIGTLYPLFLEEITGQKISVGPPFYNYSFVPLMIPLLCLVPFGPFLTWKRADFFAQFCRLYGAYALSLIFAGITIYLLGRFDILPFGGLFIAYWIIFGAFAEILFRARLNTKNARDMSRRLRHMPGAQYGTFLAHAGLGVMVLGIVGTTCWQQEKVLNMVVGQTTNIAGFEVTFKGVEPKRGPNYREMRGDFDVRKKSWTKPLNIIPSKRVYDASKMPTTEAGLYADWLGDFYIAIDEPTKDKKLTVRLYFHPLVRLIWFGTLIMFLGGLCSLLDRRLRVGAPKRAKAKTKLGAKALAKGVPVILLGGMLFFSMSHQGWAVQPDEVLSDTKLEQRARNLSKDLRCPVCQNQSIDDSDAPLAKDLRVLVRKRLMAGDTDRQVMDYLVARYGDYILLTPPFKPTTYLLWLFPALSLLMAFWLARSFFKGTSAQNTLPKEAPLSQSEEEQLKALLEDASDDAA